MKCVVNAKFNIGDQVYLAETYHEYWANSKPYLVTGILISITESEYKITYRIQQDLLTDVVSEHLIFATYEECAQWCKNHN